MLFKEVYQVVENPHEQDAGIEIISGEWEGLVYQYGDVQFVDGEPQMNFKRTIRRLPKDVEPSEEAIEELLNNQKLLDKFKRNCEMAAKIENWGTEKEKLKTIYPSV